MKWDLIGAIAAVVAIPITILAILVQITTPEIRCRFGLDKSGCSDVTQSSPSIVKQTPVAIPLPSNEKPSVAIESPSPSPRITAERPVQSLREKLIGEWIYADTCEVNNGLAKYTGIMTFHKDGKAGELILFTMTDSNSTFFSTENSKISISITVEYEWNVEESYLHMKVIDRSSSFKDFSVNGKPVKDSSRLEKTKNNINQVVEKRLLKGKSIKYKTLNIEESLAVLEKTEEETGFLGDSIIKFKRLKLSN